LIVNKYANRKLEQEGCCEPKQEIQTLLYITYVWVIWSIYYQCVGKMLWTKGLYDNRETDFITKISTSPPKKKDFLFSLFDIDINVLMNNGQRRTTTNGNNLYDLLMGWTKISVSTIYSPTIELVSIWVTISELVIIVYRCSSDLDKQLSLTH
jgi:hypothetical protein